MNSDETEMLEDMHPSDASATLAADLGDLQLNVTVEMAQLSLSLNEIGGLAVGQVLCEGIDLASPVTIRVNGTALGSGVLVQIGNTLGVQINRWNAAAAEP